MNKTTFPGKLLTFQAISNGSHSALSYELNEGTRNSMDICKGNVLILDRDERRAQQMAQAIARDPKPGKVEVCTEVQRLMRDLQKTEPDLVIVALTWSGAGTQLAKDEHRGVDILSDLRLLNFGGEVIVFQDSAQALSIEEYCRPFAIGASDFLDSSAADFIEQLREKVKEGLLRKLRRRYSEDLADKELRRHLESLGIIGRSAPMVEVFHQVRRAARLAEVTVLITGESGTGKQRLAECIHRLDDKRKDGPFVTVNCTAIPGELAESELFGHTKGAFTGASSDRAGYLRMAQGGTLLLDEVGDLPLPLQPKLLRFLQEKKVAPVGADEEISVDVRVIAATNRNLDALVESGRFRLDLYQRLSTLLIEVPALRDRKGDLSPLISFFLEKYKDCCPEPVQGVDARVMEILSTLDLPGNVRQLENLLLQIVSGKDSGSIIEIRDLPENLIRKVALRSPDESEHEISGYLLGKVFDEGMSLSKAVECCEKLLLRAVLYKTKANKTRAAEILKTTTRTIFNKIQKHDLVT